ncbi:hypothetical protein GQ55_4G120800 [Panicum hallii var. hallii]|uniref:Uncharacterized protein n=1 Tax=Panicum hallii var. hallii TaxID=1504633 RepID=A0A2T7DXT0_9POAL|nr:hypothetical protein GQ55_4G120800 [Panicum hallii var. hallii]
MNALASCHSCRVRSESISVLFRGQSRGAILIAPPHLPPRHLGAPATRSRVPGEASCSPAHLPAWLLAPPRPAVTLVITFG